MGKANMWEKLLVKRFVLLSRSTENYDDANIPMMPWSLKDNNLAVTLKIEFFNLSLALILMTTLWKLQATCKRDLLRGLTQKHSDGVGQADEELVWAGKEG